MRRSISMEAICHRSMSEDRCGAETRVCHGGMDAEALMDDQSCGKYSPFIARGLWMFTHRLHFLTTSMTRTKRAALTTDELSRRQEEPFRKRARVSPLVDEAGGDSSDGIPERDELMGYQEESSDEDDEEDAESNSHPDNSQLLSSAIGQDRFHAPAVNDPRPPASEPSKSSVASFSSLGISAPLQSALSAMSIKAPTEVQAACIPPLLLGQKDDFHDPLLPYTPSL